MSRHHSRDPLLPYTAFVHMLDARLINAGSGDSIPVALWWTGIPAELEGLDRHDEGRTMAMPRRLRLRAAANWVNGSTLLGLAIATAQGTRPVRDADGIWHAAGVRGPHGRRVFTVGNVVLHRHDADHLHRRPGLLAHEIAHATQWAWTGPAFVPLYLTECLISWAVTGNTACGNAFEIGAGLERGGYRTPALRRRARRGRRGADRSRSE